MREREFQQRPKSMHANNFYKNENSNNLIMVKSLQDSLHDDRVLMHNYKKNNIYNRIKMPNNQTIQQQQSPNIPISNSNSSLIKDNVSMCSSVNSVNLRNSKKVSQILRKFSTELSNSKEQIVPPFNLKHRNSHSSGTNSSLNRKILSHEKHRSNSGLYNQTTEYGLKPSNTSISDDLIASFQTVPSDSLKSQIINSSSKKPIGSDRQNEDFNYNNDNKSNSFVKHIKSVTSVSSSIPLSNSLTKTSSLSSIEIKPQKEEMLSNKAIFSFKYESPRRNIVGTKSSQNNNEKIDVVVNINKKETINDNNDELINVVKFSFDNQVCSNDDKIKEVKKTIEESNEDKIITNLFYPILSSLDANEKITEKEQDLKRTPKLLSSSAQSIISITCNNNNNNNKINSYSTDGSIRTHSSLVIYQNENNNLDFTDNDAISNIDDYYQNDAKNEESNKNDGIYENNNFYENEIVYENLQPQESYFLERKNSDSNKSERKNSILLDKILFNDIQVLRVTSKNDKYYVPR